MPKNVPPCARTPEHRARLGRLIVEVIQAGLNQRGIAVEWWSECERIHRNEWTLDEEQAGEGIVPLHVPFSQPRQDMLTAQVCSVLTKADPYMVAESASDSGEEAVKETTVHKFWKSAGFEQRIRRASHICTDTNKVWTRLCWERVQLRPYAGLVWDVIHPHNVCIFPATQEGILGARLVGHRFYRRLAEVEAMQDAGVYFEKDVVVTGGDSPQEYDQSDEIESAGVAPSSTGPDRKDDRAELWDVCFRYDCGDGGGEKWYRATVAFKTMALLSFESYPYSRPWYFDASYVTTHDEAYWSSVSVGRHLSALQDAVDKCHTALYNGTMMQSYPPIFGPELPEKDFRYSYGQYVPTDAPGQNWSPNITFKGEPITQHLEILDMAGDRTARISANTQGTMQARETTATESSIIAADVSVGIEEYISNFGDSLASIAEFTCELLAIHFSDWQQEAQFLGVTQEMLLTPCLWEANGKSPGNTPGAKIAAAEKLMQAAAQFGPASGIDIYELVKVIINNLGFFGSENIQVPRSQLQQPIGPPGGVQPGGPPGGGVPAVPAPGMAVAGPLPAGPPPGVSGPMLSPGSPG